MFFVGRAGGRRGRFRGGASAIFCRERGQSEPDSPESLFAIRPGSKQDSESFGLLVPLATVAEGETAVVRDVKGPRGIAMRLAAFGLMPGKSVKMLRNSAGDGPLLLEIDNTRLGLAKSICMNVLTGGPDSPNLRDSEDAPEIPEGLAV